MFRHVYGFSTLWIKFYYTEVVFLTIKLRLIKASWENYADYVSQKRIEVNFQDLKSKVEFKNQILTLFTYDVDNDEMRKHPTHLCAKCVWRNLLKVVVKATVHARHEQQEITDFKPHDKGDRVCSKFWTFETKNLVFEWGDVNRWETLFYKIKP